MTPGVTRPWPRWRRAVVTRRCWLVVRAGGLVLLALLAASCQAQVPPAPGATPAATDASDAPATVAPPALVASAPSPPGTPSPSPDLAAAVGVPSPSVVPAPTATPASAGLTLDDYPFAVMIDNIAEARPQFGLAAADVVYEAPAEAGIPRLMPIYLRSGAAATSIGPVRSTRHYFVSLANEYRAPLVHIGASPQGFDELSATGLPDVDESRGDAGFHRDPSRVAPHNAFVSTTSIRDVLRQRGGPVKVSLGPLTFGSYAPGPDPATSLKIAYPGPDAYSVAYDYDADLQIYRRIMDGLPHRDGSTGDQYTATSIIIQFADVQPIPHDTAGRVDVSLIGSGKGILVAQGTQVPLQWKRSTVRAATQFTRDDGAAFALPDGQVWIQIVPLETHLSVS